MKLITQWLHFQGPQLLRCHFHSHFHYLHFRCISILCNHRLVIDLCNGCNLITFIQPDQFYTLCCPSLFTDIRNFHPDGNTTFTGDHQVFFFRYIQHAYQCTGFFGVTLIVFTPFPPRLVKRYSSTAVLFPNPFSLTTNTVLAASVPGFTQIIPTTSSSLSSTSIPATPMAPRPVALTFSSEKRMALPLFTAIMISAIAIGHFCFQQFITF